MKRRKLPEDRVNYPMIIESEMYKRLKKKAEEQDASVASLIDNAIIDFLLGSNKDRHIEHLTRMIKELKEATEGGNALAEALEEIAKLKGALGEATGKLSEIEGYLNQ